MSAANPYERRRGSRREGQAFAGMGIDVGGAFARAPAESPLTIRELEAMVYSAVNRGREVAREQEFRAVGHAKREAWEEGHTAGQVAGRNELLVRIDQRVGARVRDIRDRAGLLLDRVNADPRKVTKDDLAVMVDEMRGLLSSLVHAHHDEFQEHPF